jgi:wyosine [tRNA(Phe)-imidazoG37] synthetase (radical SAM superfamily)
MGDLAGAPTVYGPVLSWRLGRSLGIDAVPPPKTCTFDCIYCQLGRTFHRVSGPVEARVGKEDVLRDVKRALDLLDPSSVDYVTFSGSGEPTLNPKLGDMIEGLKRLTTKPVAVLTNASLVDRGDVRDNLAKADLVIAKLDAPNQPLLEAINRPAEGILHRDIMEGLVKLGGEMSGELALQMMFLESKEGGVTNAGNEAVEGLIRLVEEIEPDEVQVNTPTRPPSEGYVLAIERNRIESIAERFRASVKNARIVSRYEEKARVVPKRLGHEEVGTEILSLIRRRPCSSGDIAASLNLPREVVAENLNKLMKRGKVSAVKYDGQDYFRTQ